MRVHGGHASSIIKGDPGYCVCVPVCVCVSDVTLET